MKLLDWLLKKPPAKPKAVVGGGVPTKPAPSGSSPHHTLDSLLRDLQSGSSYRAEKAVGELTKLDPNWRQSEAVTTAIPSLVANLLNEDAATDALRVNSAMALGYIGATGAVEPLLRLLSTGSQPLRGAVMEALGRIGDARAVEPLLAAFMSSDESLWRAATPLLSLGWVPSELDQQARIAYAGKDFDKLSRLGQASVPYLLKILWTGYYTGRAQEAADALTRVDSNWKKFETVTAKVPSLISDLTIGTTKKDDCSKENAATALGYIGDPRAVDSLLGLLTTENAKLRSAVIRALGRIADPRAIKPLEGVLQDDNPSLRSDAALVLESFFGWKSMGRPPNALSDGEMVAILERLCQAYARTDKNARNTLEPQATAIGRYLNDRGGTGEMLRLFNMISPQNGRRTLEMHWGGIGDWRG